MHLKRWITSLCALPLIIILIQYGGRVVFTAAIWCISVLSLREYFRIAFIHRGGRTDFPLLYLAYLTGAALLVAAHSIRFDYLFMVLVLNLLICGLSGLFRFKSDPFFPDMVNKQVVGVLYIPALLSFLVLIRNAPQGILWIFFLLCLVAAGDIGAYYTGTYFGRHKLCPSVSPKKTIEGSLGGLCANILIGLIFKAFVLKSLPLLPCLAFSVAIGAAGQVGDLFESILKRAADVKDSGTLLPGHGGMLDRIDALLFAAPLAYFLMGHIF